MENERINEAAEQQEVTVQDNYDQQDEEVEIVSGRPRSRITVDFGFTLPQSVKDMMLSPFNAGYSSDNDPNVTDGQISFHTIFLTLGVLTGALMTFYRSGLSPLAEVENVMYVTVTILVIVQLASAVTAIVLMCSNSRSSGDLEPSKDTPGNFRISSFFLDMVWDNKYGIRVVFMWIFGLGCVMYSGFSIKALTACLHESVEASGVFGIIYHANFIVFVFSQLLFVNYFTNFRFSQLTVRRRHGITILFAGMVSIWFYVLTTMASSFGQSPVRIPWAIFNGTGCSNITLNPPWINNILELLHPTLLGFSFMGIHLLFRLKQASLEFKQRQHERDDESNGSGPPGQCGENCANEVTIIEENVQIGQIRPNFGYYFAYATGTIYNVLLLIHSCLLVYYLKDHFVIVRFEIFKPIFIITLMIVLLVTFRKLKQNFQMTVVSASYGIQQNLFLVCYAAIMYYRLLLLAESVFILRSHNMEWDNDLMVRVIFSLIDNILMLLLIYLQTVFILQSRVYTRKGRRCMHAQVENVCCLLGLFNFGQWVYYSIAALPSIKFYLLNQEVLQTPSLNFINTVVFPLVTLYYLKSWMNLRYIYRRFRKERIQSNSDNN